MTKPQNFHAVGLPPVDLLDDVAQAWFDAGLDVHKCFAKAVQVTDEWTYTHGAADQNACARVARRLVPKHQEERRVPLKLGTLAQTLNPQPQTAKVLHGLLDWIDRVDLASQRGEAPPAPRRSDGAPLFPDTEWWLTEMERRRPKDDAAESDADEEELELGENPTGGNATCSSSGWTSSDSDSAASLPAGPPVKRACTSQVKATTAPSTTSTTLSSVLAPCAPHPQPSRRITSKSSPALAATASARLRLAFAPRSATSGAMCPSSAGATTTLTGFAASAASVPDLPAELRRQAKRGGTDAEIHP